MKNSLPQVNSNYKNTKRSLLQFKYLLVLIFLLIIVAGILFYRFEKNKSSKNNSVAKTTIQNPAPISPKTNVSTTPTQNSAPVSPKTNVLTTPTQNSQSQVIVDQLAAPIADFKARITKKPFGIYITPQNSPVQPERFTGYHTGTDVEYQDVTGDVPVYALYDGKIVLSRTASGYGGVFMIDFTFRGVERCALYGHIRPSSLPKIGTQVTKGEQLAVLGTGYSAETDGERRHLHFAILSNNRLDIKGYVQAKSQLSGWIDPLSLY